MAFNDKVNPKAAVKLFKIYFDVSSTSTPEWELQGRGITSWTIDQNQDFSAEADVLGYVDFDRGIAKPQQSFDLAIRKGSKLGNILFNAWFNGDQSSLDSIKILQKFEFVDAETEGYCIARLQDECAINITSFNGEAEDYLKFSVETHYSNKITTGTMAKVDPDPVVFTPDDEEEDDDDEE